MGLDGYTKGQVLQAGIAVTVQPNAAVNWRAWTVTEITGSDGNLTAAAIASATAAAVEWTGWT